MPSLPASVLKFLVLKQCLLAVDSISLSSYFLLLHSKERILRHLKFQLFLGDYLVFGRRASLANQAF